MDINKIKNNLSWDFKFDDEFKNRESGYTFIIDVLDGNALVSVYRYSPYGIKSEPLKEQPPLEMIKTALTNQGNESLNDGLFYIDKEIRNWLENNFLNN